MSWVDRRRMLGGLAAMAAAAGLSGCVRPLLAKGGDADGMRGQVALPAVDGRLDYHIDRALRARLGAPGPDPLYALSVSHRLRKSSINIARGGTATRIRIDGLARYRLVRRSDGVEVDEGRVQAESGLNATGDVFASRQTERDVEERLVSLLADKIAIRLLARADAIAAGPAEPETEPTP